MIKKDKIGTTYMVTYRGHKFVETISDDPSKWDWYRTLGLDVFEKDEREIIKEKLDALGVRYRKNSSLETLKLKLDGHSSESDNEQ